MYLSCNALIGTDLAPDRPFYLNGVTKWRRKAAADCSELCNGEADWKHHVC